ncbi:cell division protein FtsQ/DivIB [Sphingobacterium paucimobilis]|nr:FtsQ-type POTRA domain-containing protein [Sphingobacterium paucimobilis]
MRNIRWSMVFYVFLGLVIFVGLAMLMSLVSKKDSQQLCKELKVVVEGKETFIDQQDISKMIDQKFGSVVGKDLAGIKVQQIEEAIEMLPYVSNAEVHLDMDGTMQVTVQQREVVLRVINKAGREYYVDRSGKKVPVTLKYVPHVMVANGNISEGYKQPLEMVESKLVQDLVRIAGHVRGDNLWENQIVQIFVNEQRDIELIPRVGREVLVIGSADSLDYKLRRLEVYYKNILPKVGSEAYEKVNVKYGGQIICERRGNWFIDSLQMKINMKN